MAVPQQLLLVHTMRKCSVGVALLPLLVWQPSVHDSSVYKLAATGECFV